MVSGAGGGVLHGAILETLLEARPAPADVDVARLAQALEAPEATLDDLVAALDDAFGVARGHVEAVHSFTNDQNLIDNFHKGDRRGRSAVLTMVITETGAAKAVAKALPQLEGKLTGSSIRVPTPDVSLAILNLTLNREVTRDEVNEYLRRVSLHSNLRLQIDYVESPEVVSTDFVGSHRAGIVDGLATIADGINLTLYVWYDMAILLIDLLIVVRRPHVPSMKEASLWVSLYVGLALVFALLMLNFAGGEWAGQFLAGWLTEYS